MVKAVKYGVAVFPVLITYFYLHFKNLSILFDSHDLYEENDVENICIIPVKVFILKGSMKNVKSKIFF